MVMTPGFRRFSFVNNNQISFPDFFYKKAVEKVTKDTVWDGVMDTVDKLATFWGRREFVIVM